MPDTDLPRPDVPDSDPRALAFRLLDDCGLTYFFSGPGDAKSVFAALLRVAPVLHRSEVGFGGFAASIPDRKDFMWTAYDGPTRGVVAISCFPEGDSRWLMEMNIGGLTPPPAPYRWGIGMRHAQVPSAVAQEIQHGSLADLSGFEGLTLGPGAKKARPPATAPLPPSTERRLLADGWSLAGSEVYKGVAPGVEGRSQLVLLLPTVSAGWCVCSPVGDADGGGVPAAWSQLKLDYEMTVFSDMVVLRAMIPDAEVTAEAVYAVAGPLARYADQVEMVLTGADDY